MHAIRTALTAAGLCGLLSAATQAQSPADILSRFQPVIKGVEYDTPETPAEVEACKVERVTGAKGEVIGFAVRDSQGKMLRRFIDSNGMTMQRKGETKAQTHLDQWSYYRDGFEIYREVDSDEDGSLDHVQWLNAGGIRVGRISNGRLVGWKRISAEEASRVLVQALISGDMGMLETVMATADELKALGLPTEMVDRAAQGRANRVEAVKALQKDLKGWDGQTTWSRFDGMMPHVIPGDAGSGLTDEIVLYENAVVFVTPSSKAESQGIAYLHVPELIRIGETWKFLSLPRAVDPVQPVLAEVDQGSLRSAIYGRADASAMASDSSSIPPDLMKALAEHDDAAPGADSSSKELAQWHLDRIEILRKIITAARGDEEKLTFYKQVVHDLAEAYKSGLYPQGAEVFAKLIDQGGKIGSFAAYRKILAEFDLDAEKPGANLLAVQEGTLAKLVKYLDEYPKSDETADVLFQIANVNIFNGDDETASKYFARLAADFPTSDVGKKAAGAIRRLESDGKPLVVSGPALSGGTASTADAKGKSVLVLFWMSAAEPDRREIADLLDIHRRYKDKGFDVLSVNLDYERATVEEYLKGTSLPWPVIFEGGGLDSRLANELGIITTPTMILLDGDGKVVTHRVNKASEVSKYLEKPLATSPVGFNLDTKK